MNRKLLIIVFIILYPTFAHPSADRSANVRGSYGLIHMKSAPELMPYDYQIASSIEYFYQSDLFKDSDTSEAVDRTQGTIAFSFVPIDFLTTAAFVNFSNPTLDPSGPGNTNFTSGIMKPGISIAGLFDMSRISRLNKGLLSIGLHTLVEFGQISRFFSNPIINPSLVVTSDLRAINIPFRMSANAELRMATEKRYFSGSSRQAGLTNFDRFSMGATKQIGYGTGVGLEFPFQNWVPSVEWDYTYLGEAFTENPSVITLGLKASPLPYKNIIFFTAADIGLNGHFSNSFIPATPLWNVIGGLTIQSFARKKDHVVVPEDQLSQLQQKLQVQQKVLTKIERDVKFNKLYGIVKDSESKAPLADVRIFFANNPNFKEIETNNDGKFMQYYAAFDRNMVTFSKTGYSDTSKFLTMKPGEGIELEIELSKATAREEDGLISLQVLDKKNAPVIALVKIFGIIDKDERTFETNAEGEVLKPLKPGDYRIEITAPGMIPQKLSVTILAREKVIKQAILAPER